MRRIVLGLMLAALAACVSGAPGAAPSAAPRPAASEPAPEPEPVSAAEELVSATRSALARWAEVGAAEADGYRSLGDGFTGHEHFFHPSYVLDGEVLDPRRPESLVYRITPAGRELVSAMYMLPVGATMDDVPDLGDPRAVWHIHDDLCFDTEGRIAGRLVDGECRPGGIHIETPPMLHVWVVEHPCGPFADLDGCPHDH